MTNGKKIRAMWLLNHGTARKFDVAMLKQVGIDEIFLPKKYPDDISFRSASVDFSEDPHLTIPKADLDILNEQNWYGTPSKEAWDIANRNFDILFFIVHDHNIIKSISKYYRGIIIWRAFGLDKSLTYSKVLDLFMGKYGKALIESLGRRFYFGQSYDHLHKIEEDYLKKRSLFLPLGMSDCKINDVWQGSERKIFFVCPGLGFNNYYQKIYDDFVRDFDGLDYAIGGSQPLPVAYPNVLGYVPKEIHDRNMQEMRVMFYHSIEPNHIHYHPFEAVKAGMPLVFMGGGMLDRMGGDDLPGRCKNIQEARYKIERILNDDWDLIEAICKSQVCLLDLMRPENCIDKWREGFVKIMHSLDKIKNCKISVVSKPKRIAVILPVEYKGGTLRGAKLLAQAIETGAKQTGEKIEVIFCHLTEHYLEEDFADLSPSITRRSFKWRVLDSEEANRALIYAGMEQTLKSDRYLVVDDSISQLMDCDLLVLVSDRLSIPLLPIKPYIVIVYDYIQRYVNFLSVEMNKIFIDVAHAAEKVLVTTQFTYNDAVQFAGLPSHKVVKVPMLTPQFSKLQEKAEKKAKSQYFVWPTNAAMHKNHENSFQALSLYYDKFGGQLECHVTGVNTENFITSDLGHLSSLVSILEKNNKMEKKIKFLGELSGKDYQSELQDCQFLWHSALIDNGTFSVVEAACLGVPALSSDYPAMQEIDEQFNLNLCWMNPDDPENMAKNLKMMETKARELRAYVPTSTILLNESVEKLSSSYWEVVKECL